MFVCLVEKLNNHGLGPGTCSKDAHVWGPNWIPNTTLLLGTAGTQHLAWTASAHQVSSIAPGDPVGQASFTVASRPLSNTAHLPPINKIGNRECLGDEVALLRLQWLIPLLAPHMVLSTAELPGVQSPEPGLIPEHHLMWPKNTLSHRLLFFFIVIKLRLKFNKYFLTEAGVLFQILRAHSCFSHGIVKILFYLCSVYHSLPDFVHNLYAVLWENKFHGALR